MNTCTIALISRIRENANRLILDELKKSGLDELSPSHGDILMILFHTNSIPMQEIAKKIHRTKATTTVLIDKLEKIGFVKRTKSQEDSRYTNVILTKKGEEFKTIFEQISNKLNTTALKDIEECQIKELEKLLKKIRDNLE